MKTEKFYISFYFIWSNNCLILFLFHQNREILDTEDGGQIAIDWANRQSATNKVIVLVVCGLVGSSSGNGPPQIVQTSTKMNCIAAVMCYRGVDVDLKTPRTPSAIDYTDLEFVVKQIKKRYPQHKLFAAGISAGNLLICI